VNQILLDRRAIGSYDKYKSGIFDLELDMGSAFHRTRIEQTICLLENFERAGGRLLRLLDVGCGPGYFLEAVCKRFPDLKATGLDLSPSALRCAAARLPDSEFVLADAHDPPFSPGYFDVLLLNNVLEHLPAPLVLLGRLRRILSPGGCLVISTPSRYRFENLILAALGKPTRLMSSDHVTEYTVGQLVELLNHSGYELRQILGPKSKPSRWTMRSAVAHYFLKPALYGWLQMARSNHVLDSTAFFLATKAV
jgi:SAM-dependent methyltransferase